MMEIGADGSSTLKRTVPRPQLNRQCCRKAYLRGAFLGAGSMTNPEKNYHLEWIAVDEILAQTLDRVLDRTEIHPHTQVRRGQTVVYLKSAQQIVDVLAMMGAPQAVMDMENVRIMRQLRGQANRAANCDMHNTEKTLNASEEQLHGCFARGAWTETEPGDRKKRRQSPDAPADCACGNTGGLGKGRGSSALKGAHRRQMCSVNGHMKDAG